MRTPSRWRSWFLRGPFDDGLRWLEQVIARSRDIRLRERAAVRHLAAVR